MFNIIFRRQLKIFQVSVHIIEPGLFKTNMNNIDNHEKRYRERYDQCPDAIKQEYGEQYVQQGMLLEKKLCPNEH